MDMLSCGFVSIGVPCSSDRRDYDALQGEALDRVRLLWQPTLVQQEGCDLLLMPVQPATLEDAIEEMTRLRGRCLACCVIVICADLEADQIGTLLAAGAFDFVSVPYVARELHTRLQRAADLLPRRRLDATATVKIARAHDLVGSHPDFMKQLASLPVIAGCDASVLILGETGTGKEVFARAIHYMSPRASRPLVAVNCGAIPTELMESELFGCMRGAFTSAHAARSGLVREAEGGTLFLDEIDSLPLGAQTKLLRFLQEKEYRPIGGASACHADVRVMAASNHDLAGLTERGAFRCDLYFRLNVLNLSLPALRDRREDIPALATYFIEQCCRKSRRPVLSLTSQALRKLTGYDWPGNVRELHNVIERAVLFCQGAVIGTDYLELPHNGTGDLCIESFRAAKARTVEAFERHYIERLLTENAGNISRAATAAKKNRRAFFALMQKHAIVPERFRAI